MRTIATYHDAGEVFIAKSRLESSGIEAFIPDENMAALNMVYAGNLGGLRLQVKDEDFEDALEILNMPFLDEE